MPVKVSRDNLQVVAFYLEKEEFAIDIRRLREVIKLVNITPLPQSADYIVGVINLRGDIIPVVDLRKRFMLGAAPPDDKTRIVITEIADNLLGVIVDQVTEVLQFAESEIKPPPQGVQGAGSNFIAGIGRRGDRLIIIIKPEEIVTNEEIVDIKALMAHNTACDIT